MSPSPSRPPIPRLALRGYASQTLVDDVRRELDRIGRSTALLHCGNYDRGGVHIPDGFAARAGGVFAEVVHVTDTEAQIAQLRLVPATDEDE